METSNDIIYQSITFNIDFRRYVVVIIAEIAGVPEGLQNDRLDIALRVKQPDPVCVFVRIRLEQDSVLETETNQFMEMQIMGKPYLGH